MDKRVLACFDSIQYNFYTKHYQKDEIIISPLQENHELIFIVQGTIAIYALNKDGNMKFVSMSDEFHMLGDVEFTIGGYPNFFVEAKSDVCAICLDITKEKERLDHDITFLHHVMVSLVEKLNLSSTIDVILPSVEERLLHYIQLHDTITNIEQLAYNLHCSKRQLLRILKKLVTQEKLIKVKKGVYRKL